MCDVCFSADTGNLESSQVTSLQVQSVSIHIQHTVCSRKLYIFHVNAVYLPLKKSLERKLGRVFPLTTEIINKVHFQIGIRSCNIFSF